MPGPIGQEDDVAAEVGGVGSLNAKLRLATSQLATIAANGGGSSSSSSSGSFAAFFPAKAALADLTPNPTTTVVGAFPHTWDPVQQSWMRQRSFPSHTDLASGASISSAGVMLWNAGASVSERIRTANAASGTTGTGLLAAGSMVYDGTVWWPKKGNNLAQFVQGAVASGGIFTGSPLVMAGLFTSGSVGSQSVVMPLVTDSVGRLSLVGAAAVGAAAAGNPVLLGAWDGTNVQYLKMSDTSNNLLKVQVGGGANVATVANTASDVLAAGVNLYTAGFPMSFNGATWERVRSANAASGTTGVGLVGAGNQVYDSTTGLWHSWRMASATGASLSVGAGAVGMHIWNGGTGWDLLKSVANSAGDGVSLANAIGTHAFVFNSAGSYDRTRTASAASGTTGTGLMGAGNLVYDATTAIWHSARQVTVDAATMTGLGIIAAGQVLMNGVSDYRPSRTATGAGTATVSFSNLATAAVYCTNGSNADLLRNNVITNQFNGGNATSGATNHATQVNYNNSGLIATLNVTSVSGAAPTLDIKLQIADGAGTFYDLTDSAGNTVAFTQKTTTGTDTLKLQPGLVERLGVVANRQYSGQLPRSYRFVSTVAGNLMNFTYRLDVSELK